MNINNKKISFLSEDKTNAGFDFGFDPWKRFYLQADRFDKWLRL